MRTIISIFEVMGIVFLAVGPRPVLWATSADKPYQQMSDHQIGIHLRELINKQKKQQMEDRTFRQRLLDQVRQAEERHKQDLKDPKKAAILKRRDQEMRRQDTESLHKEMRFDVNRHIKDLQRQQKAYEQQMLDPRRHRQTAGRPSPFGGPSQTKSSSGFESYTPDMMMFADGQGEPGDLTVEWDENGQMVGKNDMAFEWNWDDQLRRGGVDTNNEIVCKYSPDGIMTEKSSTQDGQTSTVKYIMANIGGRTVPLMEIDKSTSQVLRTYIYDPSGQVLIQHAGDYDDDRYFYLHDRLGSVRQVIDGQGQTVEQVTYGPFGQAIEGESDPCFVNPFGFAGYLWDGIAGMYYNIARWYDPQLGRFTARDPVEEKYHKPLIFNKYLYCANDPVNRIDPTGMDWENPKIWSNEESWQKIHDAIQYVDERGFPEGSYSAFDCCGEFDIKNKFYWDTFTIGKVRMSSGDFGNYLTAYTNVYLYGFTGEYGTRHEGNKISWREHGEPDDLASRYFITAGLLQAVTDRRKEGTWGGPVDTLHYSIEKLRLTPASKVFIRNKIS